MLPVTPFVGKMPLKLRCRTATAKKNEGDQNKILTAALYDVHEKFQIVLPMLITVKLNCCNVMIGSNRKETVEPSCF